MPRPGSERRDSDPKRKCYKPNLAPYANRPAKIDLNARNPGGTEAARASAVLDLDEPDQLDEGDEQMLNRVIWESIKGKSVPYPGPTRRFLGSR